MKYQPDFIIIGAMKCATSTLQKQLSLQPGIFMTTPKEPNFFSNDSVYQQGIDWYSDLYQPANSNDIKGEASTHYSKLPTYPKTLERLKQYCTTKPKIIYIVRHPIDRLISHYIHEWSQGNISTDISSALKSSPELIDYSKYYYQLSPYLSYLGQDKILIVFYDQIINQPQQQLERCARFIGYTGDVKWVESESKQNVSSQRVRKFPGYETLINTPILASLRRNLIPQIIRNKVKQRLTMQSRPSLDVESTEQLKKIFNKDLAKLGTLMDIDINCDNFKQAAAQQHYG
jgi:hypothetical protein